VCDAVGAADDLELAATVDVGDEPRLLAEAGCDVVVDFTTAEAARITIPWLAMHGIHAVVGTTGFDETDLAAFRSAYGDSGPANCLIAPNFAISAVLMMRFSEIAAPFFDTVEVIEYHHDRKIDAPSGTAVTTAESLESLALVKKRQVLREEDSLAEEVFEPPPLEDVALVEDVYETYRRRPSWIQLDSMLSLGSVFLAAVALAWVVAAFVSFPGSLLLPFPWQSNERDTFEGQQRRSLYLSVDRGAKTHFLLDGQFPERLQDLISRHLLGPNSLRDPQGRPLRYEPSEIRYEMAPVAQGEPIAELGTDEAITGDFLLDLDFYSIDDEDVVNPLILID